MSPEELQVAREGHRREFCQKYCPVGSDGHCDAHKVTLERLQKAEGTVLIGKTVLKPFLVILVSILVGLFGTLAVIYWKVSEIKADVVAVRGAMNTISRVVDHQEGELIKISGKLDKHLEGGAVDLHKKLHEQMGK